MLDRYAHPRPGRERYALNGGSVSNLLRLRDASKAALIVVHHVRKSIGRDEIGGTPSAALRRCILGDSYLLLTHTLRPITARPPSSYASSFATPRRRNPIAPTGPADIVLFRRRSGSSRLPSRAGGTGRVTKALTDLGQQARYNQLRQQVMDEADCSKRTAQPQPLRRLASRVPSCRPTGNIGCRF